MALEDYLLTEDNFTGNEIEGLDDTPILTPEELKDKFDAASKNVIMPAINGVINTLISDADNALFLKIYPVGSIYMSVNSTNPSTLFGGTWTAWGAGRVPVGVNASDTAFDTVEETGGAKTHTLTVAEMPNHDFGPVSGTAFLTSGGGQTFQGYLAASGSGGIYSTGKTEAKGSNTPFNIVQPYITCYMWKRTA